jgi:phosphohistidine phosphatase
MDLYLIRHAHALAVGEQGITNDADRSLSPEGIEVARKLGRTLHGKNVEFGLVLTSPLLRARQTAEEMLTAWGSAAPALQECPDLEPGMKPKRLTRFLRVRVKPVVALVGHQPDLGRCAAWLIGSKEAQIDFAKGGVAHIVCADRVAKGDGVLVALLTPEWLAG